MKPLYFSFLAVCLAVPAPDTPLVSPEAILAVAPTSNTCEGAPQPEECVDNRWAAQAMSIQFSDFKTTSPGELVALTSLIAFESGDFKYNRRHFPVTPGVGTRNMQSADFNLQYASVFPTLRDQLSGITGGQTTLSDSQKDQVMQLLIDSQADFGSAAWYLGAKCPDIKAQFAQGFSVPVWETYVTQCVGGTMDDNRRAYMHRAAQAFGVQV